MQYIVDHSAYCSLVHSETNRRFKVQNMILQQLFYAIKTQIKAPKRHLVGTSLACHSDTNYGKRVASLHRKKLL